MLTWAFVWYLKGVTVTGEGAGCLFAMAFAGDVAIVGLIVLAMKY